VAGHASWPGAARAVGMQLGGAARRNPIEQEGRDARTPGGLEARAVASVPAGR
jgi:hypothetical protein